MTWTPNYSGEPHAYAQVLTGDLPFTPDPGNFGELERSVTTQNEVTLTFEGALVALPADEDCLVESIRAVWVNGRRLSADSMAFPEGWTVVDVTATSNWPGSTVMATSPPEFEGLTVEVDFGGQGVRRVVALTEWRGEPGSPVIEVEVEGGGGGPGDA